MARRVAQVRSTVAVASGAIAAIDREDIEQEALIAFWQALPLFDASRASLRTFAETVIATRVVSLRRARRRHALFEPLEDHHVVGLDGIPAVAARMDFFSITEKLTNKDRRLAELLLEYSPSEASRILGIARSTVYETIGRIRVAFERAGYAPPRRNPK
jgi:RNA polymerase sigma factor (sigma-70 family)